MTLSCKNICRSTGKISPDWLFPSILEINTTMQCTGNIHSTLFWGVGSGGEGALLVLKKSMSPNRPTPLQSDRSQSPRDAKQCVLPLWRNSRSHVDVFGMLRSRKPHGMARCANLQALSDSFMPKAGYTLCRDVQGVEGSAREVIDCRCNGIFPLCRTASADVHGGSWRKRGQLLASWHHSFVLLSLCLRRI